MVALIIVITFIYVFLILSLTYGISKVVDFKECETKVNTTKFSIVIPFRNEEHNLDTLLKTINALKYPKSHFEIIFIDDFSDDKSVLLINDSLISKGFNFKIIANTAKSKSPKKKAISKAINIAKYDWIVTTDADCYLPELWLNSFNAFIIKYQPKMIVAPVTYTTNGSFFEDFQFLDFLSLQAATIGCFGLGKPFLCNGANFAYQKTVFLELNGFKNNTNIASGDDVFLLQECYKKYPKTIGYLKTYNAIVATKPVASISTMIQQHVRWASKSTAYSNPFGKTLGLLIFIMNALIVSAFLASLFGLLPWTITALILTLKIGVDFVFLLKTVRFFKQNLCVKYFAIHNVLYSIFSVFIVFYAMFFKYKWKGRSYSR